MLLNWTLALVAQIWLKAMNCKLEPKRVCSIGEEFSYRRSIAGFQTSVFPNNQKMFFVNVNVWIILLKGLSESLVEFRHTKLWNFQSSLGLYIGINLYINIGQSSRFLRSVRFWTYRWSQISVISIVLVLCGILT